VIGLNEALSKTIYLLIYFSLGTKNSGEITVSISLVGLTLHVADVERSLDFYKRLPESSILFHMPGKFALLKVGGGRLGLLQDQKRPFHVEIDCQDLDATCALLKESGFQPEGPTTRAWGERDALLVDPDGNLVEFGQAHEAKM
jgi:catechol 2,3-dioxygenase-like lactoylglutathione lyase family enzyme